MKTWITEKALKVTNGYTCPFLGEQISDEPHAHFVTFAVPVSKADQFDSYEELLADMFGKRQQS